MNLTPVQREALTRIEDKPVRDWHGTSCDDGVMPMLPEWWELEAKYNALRLRARGHKPLPRRRGSTNPKDSLLPGSTLRSHSHRPHRPQPVISDRGEWFASTTLAGRRFRKTRAGIHHSIVRGSVCSKRHWRYATPEETAAALEAKENQPHRAA